jgi:multidrug transporter EmrE-like cation transporter
MMLRITPLLFGGYTVLSVVGLVLLRANVASAAAGLRGDGGGLQAIALTIAGMTCYLVGFALWLAILARVPLSRAYPTAVGLTLVFTTFAAWVVLDEDVGLKELGGATAVFIGIWLLTSG